MRGRKSKVTPWICFAAIVILTPVACVVSYKLRPYFLSPALSLRLGKSADQKQHFALRLNGIPLRLTKERLNAVRLPIALTSVDDKTERGVVEHYTNGITVRREEDGNAQSISVFLEPRYGGRPVTFSTDVGITKDTGPEVLSYVIALRSAPRVYPVSPIGSPSIESNDEHGIRVYYRDDDGYSLLFAFEGSRIYMVSLIAP
jgi:hypothetical protein